jgi:hypothetical protein
VPLPRRYHPLLGSLPDAEIARRAGCGATTVLEERRRLGIAARQDRDLDAVGPEGTLKLIRARARSGESMRAFDLGGSLIVRLAQRHFGGWYQAVGAAGLKPAGKPRKAVARSPKRALTTALLRGPQSAAELERLTGVSRDAIRTRRKRLGIVRRERRGPDRSWVRDVRKLLGKVPDAVIAKRVGKSRAHVGLARRELGIPAALRFQPTSIREPDLRRLDPTDALILRERYLSKPPATLPEIAKRLGVSKQRVAQREKRAVAGLIR